MKSFKQWLIEAMMDLPTALSIFGLAQPPKNDEELKTLYKKLAMQNHPDRGGSTQKMQELNAARDFLKRHVGGTYVGGGKGASGQGSWVADYKAKREPFEKTVVASVAKFFKSIDTEAYRTYFEELFKKPFKVETVYGEASSMFSSVKIPTLEMKIFSDGGADVFTMHLSGAISDSVDDLMKGNGLAAQNVVFGYYINADALTGGKKQVVVKRILRKKADAALLTDPSIVFPKARMQKLATGTVRKNSALKKRDFEAVFQSKWGCEKNSDGTWMFVFEDSPKAETHLAFRIERFTLMRKGVYQISSACYEKKSGARFAYWKKMNGVPAADCKFLPEGAETMEFFEKLFAYAKKNPVWKKIADYIKTESAATVDKISAKISG